MFDILQLRGVTSGEYAALEAELAGFLDAGFGLRNAANFAGQANFAEEDRSCVEDSFAAARCDCRDDAQIDRWLVDLDTAGDIDKYILVEELGAHFFLEHGDQQRDPVVIDSNRRSPRHG